MGQQNYPGQQNAQPGQPGQEKQGDRPMTQQERDAEEKKRQQGGQQGGKNY